MYDTNAIILFRTYVKIASDYNKKIDIDCKSVTQTNSCLERYSAPYKETIILHWISAERTLYDMPKILLTTFYGRR